MNETDLRKGLRALGIQNGSRLIVHSSLRSFGYVEGGAEAVVNALMGAVGDGLILMPSFNHGAPYEAGSVFDIRSTPATTGAIPEAFRRREGVYRSMNPTHPFAIWGKDAKEIASAHEAADAMGKNSPLDFLMRSGGCALLLGVGYNRNTFHHYVETMEGAPCLRGRGEEYEVIDENGGRHRAKTWSWREKSCPIDDAARYAARMQPYETTAMLGDCKATYFALRDCYRVVCETLAQGLDGFPPCRACAIRPRVCAYTVSDSPSEPRLKRVEHRPEPDSSQELI